MIAGVRENIEVMLQGESLIRQLGDRRYKRAAPPLFDSAPGVHFRHILGYYACFLDGLDRGLIDYSSRARDTQVEHSGQAALSESRRLRFELEQLNDHTQTIALLTDGAKTTRQTCLSSVSRELDFLLSHSIHHHSLLAVMARLQGLTLPVGFGVAPSTLRFRSEMLKAARS